MAAPTPTHIPISVESGSTDRLLAKMPIKGVKRRSVHGASTVISGRVVKTVPRSAFRGLNYTSRSMKRAQILANILPGRQRADEKLLQEMLSRRATGNKPAAEATASLTRQSTAASVSILSVQPLAPIVTKSTASAAWEIEAQKMIEKKGLSMNKELGRSTWKQKYSNDVRLKLLKNDGFDITALRAPNASADEIIDALLARVDARKQERATAAASPAQAATPSLKPVAQIHTASVQVDTAPSPPTDSEPVVEPILLSTLAGRKRKHDHSIDEQLNWHKDCKEQTAAQTNGCPPVSTACISLCACGPSPKRFCLIKSSGYQFGIVQNALMLRMKQIRSRFFQPSRIARIMSSPSPFEAKTPVNPSTIVFSSPTTLLDQKNKSGLCISSRAPAFMVEDLKLFSTASDASGNIYIEDPNPDEDAQQHRLRGTKEADQWRHRISISEGPSQQITLKGDTQAVISVLTHFKENELIHPTQWIWNGETLVPEHGEGFTLSTDSQSNLGRVIERLEVGKHVGGIELCIQQCPDEKKLRYN